MLIKIPAQPPQNLPGKVQMRRPSPRNWTANAVESVSHVKNQCDRSWVFFASTVLESFHLEQSLPHSALRSSIPTFGGVPPDTLPVLPRHLWRPQSFPPADHGKSAMGRSLVTSVGIRKEHRQAGLLWPSPTLFHFSKNFTIFPVVSFDKSNRTSG